MKKPKQKTKSKSVAPIRFNSKSPDYWFLGSFAPTLVMINVIENGKTEQLWFPNVECGFHYLKTTSSVFREKIMQCASPAKARYYGSAKAQCPMRPGWDDDLSLRVMRMLDWAKFSQNRVLAQWLLDTDEAELQEYAPWEKDDPYWGVNSKGEGPNRKGKVLMQVRKRLAEGEPTDLIPTINMDKYK